MAINRITMMKRESTEHHSDSEESIRITMTEREENFRVEEIMEREDIFHRFGEGLSLDSDPKEHEGQQIHGLIKNNVEDEIAEDLMEEAADINEVPIHGGFKNEIEGKIAVDRHEEASESHYDFQKVLMNGGFKNDIEKKIAEDVQDEALQSQYDFLKVPINGGFQNDIEGKNAEDRQEEALQSQFDFLKVLMNGGFKNKIEEEIAEDVQDEALQSHYDIQKVPITGGLKNNSEGKIAEDLHEGALRSEYNKKRGPMNGNLQEFTRSVSGEWKIVAKKEAKEETDLLKSLEGLDEIIAKYINVVSRLNELFVKSEAQMKKEQEVDFSVVDHPAEDGGIEEEEQNGEETRSDSGSNNFVEALQEIVEESDRIRVQFQELMSNNNW